MSQQIYIVKCDTDKIKIGVTCDIERRLSELQVSNPCEVTLVACYKSAHPTESERRLHTAMREYHIRGEWYKLDEENLACLRYLCENERYICRAMGEKIRTAQSHKGNIGTLTPWMFRNLASVFQS